MSANAFLPTAFYFSAPGPGSEEATEPGPPQNHRLSGLFRVETLPEEGQPESDEATADAEEPGPPVSIAWH